MDELYRQIGELKVEKKRISTYTSAGFKDNVCIERLFRAYSDECLAVYELEDIREPINY